MQLQEIRKQVNRQEWTQMVMDCRNSGLSIKDWCAQNGVNSKTYYYRQRRVFEAIGNRPFEHTNRAMTPATDSVEFAPLRPESCSPSVLKLHCILRFASTTCPVKCGHPSGEYEPVVR